MTKIYKLVIALSVASFVCVGLTACDDDDSGGAATSSSFSIGNDG